MAVGGKDVLTSKYFDHQQKFNPIECATINSGSKLDCQLDRCLQTSNHQSLNVEMEQNGQTIIDREELNDVEEEIECDYNVQPYKPTTIPNETRSVVNESKWFCCCGYRVRQIKWSNVLWLITLHGLFVWAYGHSFVSPVKFATVVWTVFCSMFSGFGMSVGAHRLWAHRAFHATVPLRLVLLVLQTMTINGSAFSYARDHRNHHKWPATDADPKNPARGFFFAHIGWWMLRKRPEVAAYGQKVPISDLLEDKLLTMQHRFYLPLVLVFAFLLPILIPIVAWNENPITSLALCIIRIVVVLHHLFTVNSVAHFWGHRPYNRFMKPTENHIINWISMGEGNHNYHHTFPFDYENSERSWWEVFNPATLFIEVCILLRFASHPKKPSASLVRKVIEHKGKPEYFADIDRRKLWLRIVLGCVDWIFGLFLAQWPMWIVIAYKAYQGMPLIIL